MNQIFAAEKTFILEYLNRTINATADELQAAESLFREQELPDILTIDGNTARIKIEGVLSKNGPSFIDRFFGFTGTAYNAIIESLEAVAGMIEIETVILEMDTPGGTVNGVDGVFVAVKALSTQKNVIAENHGLIASAGYWIASATSSIKAVGPAVETGSIGVIITAIDDTEFLKKIGIKRVRIVSENAPNKAADISKKSGLNILQDRVDALEKVFISRIAEGRALSEDHIKKEFGRGAVLISSDALKAGMIDEVVNGLSTGVQSAQSTDIIGVAAIHIDEPKLSEYELYITSLLTAKTPAVAGENTDAGDDDGNIQEDTMTLLEIMSSDPAVKAEVEARDAANEKTGFDKGKAEVQARIDATVNFIGNEDYPGIEALAKEVLSGKAEASALKGAVTAYDMLKEQGNSDAAVDEGAKIPDTPADDTAAVDDVAAMVAADSKKIGRVE